MQKTFNAVARDQLQDVVRAIETENHNEALVLLADLVKLVAQFNMINTHSPLLYLLNKTWNSALFKDLTSVINVVERYIDIYDTHCNEE